MNARNVALWRAPCRPGNKLLLKDQGTASIRPFTDIDEIMYRLYGLDNVRKGREAILQGHTVWSEEPKREIDTW